MSSTPDADAKLKEHDAALKEVNKIIHPNRPKNLPQGLTTGVGNIVSGAVGAVGVAVLAPTYGLVEGSRTGGVLGGILGVTGGAVVGVLGAVGLAVGGVVSGTSQIVRGVIATPQAVLAPRQGKWWNDVEGRWVYTDLPKDSNALLKGVPEDDSDLLKKFQDEVDESAKGEFHPVKVKETYYYDVLEVPPNANQSVIKRRYYTLARKYHPDKNEGDQEAAEKFKEIGEAYQVLCDPKLRLVYDKEGRGGLSADRTGAAQIDLPPVVDPQLLFAFLFGSDRFKDYIGRLATATSASVGDKQVSVETARTIQVRRVTRLAVKLAEKLDSNDEGEESWKKEATELSKASYGLELVHLIGRVYHLTSVQFMGTFDSGVGMPSIGRWVKNHRAKFQARGDKVHNETEMLLSGMRMVSMQEKLEQELAKAETHEEKKAISEKMESLLSSTLLNIIWITTVVDVTSTLHETIEMALHDQSVSKEQRRKRAERLGKLGSIFMECKGEDKVENEKSKSARTLYEEAAFAAMVETIKRKEEGAISASRRNVTTDDK